MNFGFFNAFGKWGLLTGTVFTLSLFQIFAHANAEEVNPGEVSSAKQKKKSVKGEKRRDRRSANEKETEGTEALDRFEAETVLKSKYRVDGQPLEVDPD